MNFKFHNSIIFKLSLALGIVISSILIAFILFISIKTRQEAIESAERTAISESHECAKQIQLELNKAIIANRMLCQTIGSTQHQNPDELSREGVNTILKNTLETFPDLFGAYTVWEPNAFDNKDSEYSKSEESKAGHDTTGRLIPLWYRNEAGEIKLVPIDGYENEQSSAWYFMPQKSGKETVMDPFYYNDMYLISVVNPIIKEGRFLGITGLSIKMSFVQKMVDEFDVYNKKGDVTILSDAGTIVASSNNLKLAGKLIPANYKIPASIFTDSKEVVSFNQGKLQAFVPFKLGDSGKTWVAMIQIPNNELLASSNNLIFILFVSGLLTVALLIAGVYFFARRLTKPLLTLAAMAEEIAIGNKPEMESFAPNSIEVEKLHSSLDKIVNAQREITSLCKAIAENDYTTKAIIRSPEDELSISVNKMIDKLQAASLEDTKRTAKTSELLEQAKNQTEILKAHEDEMRKKIAELKAKQAEIMQAHEEKLRKNLEVHQATKIELQATRDEMVRKEQNYFAEIQKLKTSTQKEIQIKTSAFSKFVIPVEIK